MEALLIGPLISQAHRIARSNPDLAQDLVAMAFVNYRRCSERGKDLTIGELVTFMKHRGGELRSDMRLPFGTPRFKCANDVYRKRNYLNGHLEILSMNHQSKRSGGEEREADDFGEIAALSATRDICDSVLFDLGMEDFLARLGQRVKRALLLRVQGYKYWEIAKRVGCHQDTIRDQLKEAGRAFVEYFELPQGYLLRYGLA